MKTSFGLVITLYSVIFILVGILIGTLIYLPELAGDVSYEKTTAQVRAYTEGIKSMQKDDTLSPLFCAVSKMVIPSVVVVQVRERLELQSPNESNADDFLQWFFHGGQSGGSKEAPQYLYKYGLGSGIIVDAENGYILTNWHVVNGADTVQVTLADGSHYETKWVRSDRRSDLAVLKIDAPRLNSAPLGDSGKIQIGDWVLAVGAPEGLPHTVTAGIISAIGRTTTDGYETFLQTDAAINPGNSGGPLANMAGEVIGINTAIISSAGGNEGIGLAIPSNMAKYVMKQLIEKGKVVRGGLGVKTEDVSDRLAKKLNLPGRNGALIVEVSADGPPGTAGLERDDFIVAIDKRKITNGFDLRRNISGMDPGRKITVDFYRNGTMSSLNVAVGTLPD